MIRKNVYKMFLKRICATWERFIYCKYRIIKCRTYHKFYYLLCKKYYIDKVTP